MGRVLRSLVEFTRPAARLSAVAPLSGPTIFTKPTASLSRKCLLLFSLAVVCPGVPAQTRVETQQTIRVVMDNDYAPFVFHSDEGKLQGILIDQWQAWEKKTGIKVEIHALNWSEALRRMRAGEFDVIDSIVETEERWQYFDFTPANTTVEASIFFRKDISGITDIPSLKGFPVGVKQGDQHIDRLRANGVTTVIEFPNNDAIIDAARQHKINVFVVDEPSALYLLNKLGIEDEFRHSAPILRDELRRAVRKGDAALLHTVSEGFAAIDPGELKQINDKWFGQTINSYGRYLTYAGYAAVVAILLIAVLVGWNRTLRKRILQRTAALGESERRFRQIAENIREVFWLSSADLSHPLYLSPAFENVWGRSRDSLYQDPRLFFSTIHPEDRPHVANIVEKDRERGFEVEYRVVRPDGSIRWIWDRGFPVKDESGRSYRFAGIAEDITERKYAEALLHAKEQEFRAIVENAPDQIIRYDREFRRTYVNPAVAQFYGQSAETLIGKPLGAGIVQEAGLDVKKDELAQVRQRIADVFTNGKTYDYELAWTMPTGQRYFSIRLFPELDLNGSVINVLSISRDVTERRIAEEELKKEKEILAKIFDNIPVMVGLVGDDGVQVVNPEWERTIGWTLKELREQNVDIFAEAYPDLQYRQKVLDCLAAGTGEWVDLKIKVRDGRVIDAACAAVHLSDGTKVAIARDITERKRAEDALHRSEDYLRLVIDTIPTMAWSLTPDGFLDFVNLRWLDYTGLSLEDALEDPTRTVHPEDLSRVTEKWLVAKETSEAYEDEMRLQQADGGYRWFMVRIAPLVDEQGNLLKRYGVAIDIEERKQAEEQLEQSKGRLAEAQRIAHLGSFSWDLNSNTQIWSDELYRIYGLERGKDAPTYESFLELVHTEDRHLLVDSIERALRTWELVDHYFRIIRPDGEERIINSRTRIAYDDQGHPIRKFGTAQDVTERKRTEEALREAEQKYRDIFENAGEGIFQSTPDGRYIAANPALARMYGFASAEELIHSRQDISQQVYVDPTRREEFKQQLEEQGAVQGFEHEVFRKDGSRLWISVNARAVKDEQGTVQYYEGTAQDITERQAAEEELKATSDQLRALSASLQSAREEEGTRIARELHDELGSVLTSLRWSLDEIDSILSTTPKIDANTLRAKVATMTTLVEGTLNTVRRISSELRPGMLDDVGLTAALKWEAEQFEARTGIVCRFDSSVENVHLGREQSTAIFRIFQEALTNVLRHAAATTVDVTMKEQKGEFVLRVSDNGKGMKEAAITATESLGLLGMRERAHLMGGEATITKAEGRGTAVTVRVPINGHKVS